MFANVLQPSSVSLFSSTSSEPLQLWRTETDDSSCVRLLHDTASQSPYSVSASLIPPPPLVELGAAGGDTENVGYNLDQTVLQIQSPKLPTTFIQCPPNSNSALGLKHPWMHLQVRNMGRDWSFEVGLVDHAGRTGVVRLSTFQKQPRLKFTPDAPPLLHLPLSFPPRFSRPLTAWTTINIHLPTYIPYFSHSSLLAQTHEQQSDGPTSTQSWNPARPAAVIPAGSYSHVSFVRVYATCRLRRIWFDESGPDQNVSWEFELYSAD